MYLIVGLYLPQVSNATPYLAVQIRPLFGYNEKDFIVSAVRRGTNHAFTQALGNIYRLLSPLWLSRTTRMRATQSSRRARL